MVKRVKGHIRRRTTAGLGSGRRANGDVVLAYIWSADVVTVTDVMEASGLTRATVHAICSHLADLGWIRELAPQRETGTQTGRPARRFTLADDAGYVLGVDIGEHTIKVVLADLRGSVVARKSVRGLTPRTTAATRVKHVGRLAEALLAQVPQSPRGLLATSVGVAAPVDADGKIGFRKGSPVQYDKGFRIDLAKLTAATGGRPVLLANDANLAVIAERWLGQAQGVDSVVALLSSERLGAGLVDGGRLLVGRDGEAGEMYFLDHVVGVGSAHGVAMLARLWASEAVEAGRRTVMSDADAGFEGPVTGEMVFAAAAQGDEVAVEILVRLADRFAQVCGLLGTLLNPEVVVFCGGVATAMQQLVDPITERLKSLTYVPPRIACSTLGEAVVTTGAIRLALDHVQQHALNHAPQRGSTQAG